MNKYDHKVVEKKWRESWEASKLYNTPHDVTKDNKLYVLPQLPYPSGSGLHVGHAEVYTACDIYARFQRMSGKKVLQVIGWDAFGLPAENYAIKTNVHPRINTNQAIDNFREQIKSLGISVDWDREVGSHNPDYYKWTQWFFLLLYQQGLAYRKKQAVNWCESCKTVLANEQVVDGHCERCGTEVVQKEMEQWFLKITEYADRLYDDLDKVDWPQETKRHQRNWIGRKYGINISYDVKGIEDQITVFTTRPDTNFGATFIVVAPESDFVKENFEHFKDKTAAQKYIDEAAHKTELERISEGKTKTGVDTGLVAINKLNGREIPIYISDFVIASFGTGAVIGVPGHDQRDFEFAKTKGLPIVRVVVGSNGDKTEITDISQVQEEDGIMINSDFLDGMNIHDATVKMMDYLEEKGWGKRVKLYKLRDWSVSRQRFWGAPIPMIKNSEINAEFAALPDFTLQLHAWGSSPQEHFHGWLQTQLDNQGITNKVPALPDTDNPKFDAWLETATESLNNNENSVVVGRSLSAWTALKLAESHKIRKLIIMAPTLPTAAWFKNIDKVIEDKIMASSVKSFVKDNSIDFKKVQQNVGEILFMLSTNDPYIPLAESEAFIAENLPFARIMRFRDAGHFDGKSGFDQFPKLRDEVLAEVRPELRKLGVQDLPVILPDDVDFVPTGRSPLTYSQEFQKGVEEKYGKGWQREVDTLDTFMCSSWYFFRYLDPHNDQAFASREALQNWMPVDFYLGGAEHVNGHLLYSRFFTKVLFDAGYIDFDEPFLKHRHQGTILGPDHRKMSKRWGNVINPTDVVDEYGADTIRIYEMFMGPLEQSKAWSEKAVKGVRRFIDRVYKFSQTSQFSNSDHPEVSKQLILMQKKVQKDTAELKFNTAISEFMKFMNVVEQDQEYTITKSSWQKFILCLAPYAPFITEQIWHELGQQNSIHTEAWPILDDSMLAMENITIAVQVNGKLRGTVSMPVDSSQTDVEKAAKSEQKIAKYLEDKNVSKVIFVANKIISFIVK